MRFLLDTHVLLWGLTEPARVSAAGREVLDDVESELVWSAVSTCEVAIKVSVGKLQLPAPLAPYLRGRLRALRIQSLELRDDHAVELATLPLHHRDPFDRLLVAQARVEGLTVISADPLIAAYEVRVHW